MKDTAIMTDTNSGISEDTAKQNEIYLLKMPFIIDGIEYYEFDNISYEQFIKKQKDGALISTSQPSPGHIIDMWNKILEEYDYIIYIPMSSSLSGTYQTAKILSYDYSGRVFVVNNKRISACLYESVFDALSYAKEGMPPQEILNKLEDDADYQTTYVAINSIEYLKRGGRLGSAVVAIGTILGIKPVLKYNGQKLEIYKRARGMKSATQCMLDAIEKDINTLFKNQSIHIRVACCENQQEGINWQKEASLRFPDYKIELDKIPIDISCHLGTGLLGIVAVKSDL